METGASRVTGTWYIKVGGVHGWNLQCELTSRQGRRYNNVGRTWFNESGLQWLREQMGLVRQEPALFSTSISRNILVYGKEEADMDQIAEAANAHSLVQHLPDGYHTQVGEGGTQLSGGQKQRIAIARAILRNPKILLLDEATSALDTESGLIVLQALNTAMSNGTTIVVAHKLSTIRDVDSIIVLKNGQVVERVSFGADIQRWRVCNSSRLTSIRTRKKYKS